MGFLSIKNIAAQLRDMGIKGDTDLVHVNEREKELLKAHGGSGTRNPHTGLLQYDDGGGDGGGGGGGDGGGGDSGNGDGGFSGHDGRSSVSGSRGNGNAPGGLGGPNGDGGHDTGGWGLGGYSVGPDGFAIGPRGFDSPGFSLSRGNPANDRSGQNAVAEALSLNEAMRQVGAIPGDQYAENRENIFKGEVGKLPGALASSLRDAYSPRTDGFLSMVKNMFTTPEKVDTPYTALNSLISSGYAEPTPEGFKATPKAAWGMLSSFAPTMGIVRGVVTGDPAAAIPGPMSVVGGLPSAIGLANQMQVAGITPARSSGTSGESASTRGGGGTFNAYAQYAAAMNSPLVAGYTIDPALWFANRRGLLG